MKRIFGLAIVLITFQSTVFANTTSGEGACIAGALESGVETQVWMAKSACSGVSEGQGACIAGALKSKAETQVWMAKSACS